MLALWLCGMIVPVQASTSTTITIPLDITNTLPGVQNYTNPVIFRYGWNSFGWLFIFRNPQELTNYEDVTLGWDTVTCKYKIRWFYYNNQRGNRRWPLDEDSLAILQDIDASYDDLTIDGWLFYSCMNNQAWYGQLTHTREWVEYKLVGWVDIQTSTNSYNPTLSNFGRTQNGYTSFTTYNRSAGWYIFDSAGGIWEVCGLRIPLWMPASTGWFNPYSSNHCGSTHMSVVWNTNLTWSISSGDIYDFDFHITTIAWSGWLFYYSWSESVTIGWWTRNGIFTAPTPVTIGSNTQWLPTDALLLQTIEVGATWWVSLYADANNPFWLSIHVPNGTVWQRINIYRSQDGVNRYLNTPQNGCQLDANFYCTFQTDHLSFFTLTPTQEDIEEEVEDTEGVEQDNEEDTNGNNTITVTIQKDNCPNGDFSWGYYDKKCKKQALQVTKKWTETITQTVADVTFDVEQIKYEIGWKDYVVLMPTIENSTLEWLVSRLHEAIESIVLPWIHTQEDEFIGSYNAVLNAIKIAGDIKSVSKLQREVLLQKTTINLVKVIKEVIK